MIDPQEILTQYNTLISGKSTQTIKNAEQRLKQLCEIPTFLEINKAILLEDQLSLSIKKMSAIHLGIFMKKNKRNNMISPDIIVKQYLELLSHQKMEHTLKPLLMPHLEQVLSDESNQAIRTAIMNRLIQDLSQNNVNYKEVVCIGQALIGIKANLKDVKIFINATFDRYNTLASQLHGQVSKITQKHTLINLLRIVGDYSQLIQSFIARIGLMDVETSKLLYSLQLVQSVRTAFQFTIQGNTFGSHLYFCIPDQNQIALLLNFIKKNYLSILAAFLRSLTMSVKNAEKLASNQLYIQSTFILDYCLQTTGDLLQNHMYYQLSSKSLLVPCIFETLGLIITTLRNNFFYETFRKHRTDLIERIILPCLCFSPADLDEFYENHTQFVDKILQIVDKQANSKNKRKVQEDQDIQMFDTLKTYAGQCISVLCKYQDEVLAEVFQFTMNVLQGKIGCPYPKSVFLLVLTLLKPRLTNRKDFQTRLGLFLVQFLKGTQPPQISQQNRKQQDIEYALLLLSVSKFAPDLGQLNNEILPVSFQRGVSILSGQGNETYKMLVFELFDEVNRLQNGEDYALDLLNLYNNLLLKDSSIRLLDSYYQLLQFNLEYFKGHITNVLTGIYIICKYVEQQLKKPQPIQLFLNKCCNVVRQIGESSVYLPKVIPQLEQALLPLLPYIDGRQGIDLEQDILLMLTAFLEYGKNVTVAQQEMFSIIPKVFYHQYHCTFGQAFTTVHSFIYYGANILANAPQAVQAIIQMSIASMTLKQYGGHQLSQVDNCEGVLILQSLVLACGTFLTKDIWIVVLNKVVQKLNTPIVSEKLIANLLGLLSLCLVHTQNLFTNQENLALIAPILSGGSKCVKVKWGQKVIIAGLSELIVNIDKEFIKINFPTILQIILILLESSTTKAILQTFDDDDFDYDNLIELTKNNLKILDEFTFFKQQFTKLHNSCKDMLIQVVEKLPAIRKDFLNRILITQKVANEPRNIFKIKRG